MTRALGINHVALEVGDLEEALRFYGAIFDLDLRGRVPGMAFVDLGDQFLALSEGRQQAPDSDRHFGLVVDDKEAVRSALQRAGVTVDPSGHLSFHDPWGNQVEIVAYADVQFSKTPEVLAGMDAGGLEKSDAAVKELREKGLAG